MGNYFRLFKSTWHRTLVWFNGQRPLGMKRNTSRYLIDKQLMIPTALNVILRLDCLLLCLGKIGPMNLFINFCLVSVKGLKRRVERVRKKLSNLEILTRVQAKRLRRVLNYRNSRWCNHPLIP